jgi:hypothetical protein
MKRVSANTLVGLLLVVAIIAILAVVMMSGGFGPAKSTRKDNLGHTTLGSTKLDALDDVCRMQLGQVRQAIQIHQTSDDQFPASLNELGLGKEQIECPIDHKQYDYDPSTGTVKCKHPGHENY